MHDSIGWGWWVVMSVGMVAFWAVVVWLIVTVARGTGQRSQRQAPAPPGPRELLDARLARGEISLEEYDRVREALETPRERAPA